MASSSRQNVSSATSDAASACTVSSPNATEVVTAGKRVVMREERSSWVSLVAAAVVSLMR
jgi:hypothetical protein